MFGFKKSASGSGDAELDRVLKALRRNQISVMTRRPKKNGAATRSKFGGRPAVPAGFVWPRFEAENFDQEIANRPLSFLCQINLEDVAAYDKEKLLPRTGLLLFFYEMESMKWGSDPEDKGCSRVYYFESTSELGLADFPEDMSEDYRIKEYDLSFSATGSYPYFDELSCYAEVDCSWDDYDQAVEDTGYEMDCECHKMLGYADPIQSEMLTDCEMISRGLHCGDAESYRTMPEDEKEDVKKAAGDWILLFQMASIEDDDYELMFDDCGNLYFYIRKQDLKEGRFDKAWLFLQCL